MAAVTSPNITSYASSVLVSAEMPDLGEHQLQLGLSGKRDLKATGRICCVSEEGWGTQPLHLPHFHHPI